MSVQQRTQYIVDGTDNVYMASNQAGTALSTALSTTQTGFTLTNPAGSGVNLVLLQCVVTMTTAPAGIATIVYAANVNPIAAAVVHTTPLVVRSAVLGKASLGAGLVDGAATLPAAPVVVRSACGPVATGSVSSPYVHDDIDGALVLAPGTAVSVNCLTTAISAIVSMTWREVAAF